MNKPFLLITSLAFFLILSTAKQLTAQIKLYEDHFNGGVTAGGYSPGTGATGLGYFSIHIDSGSTIRQAYLFAGKLGAASQVLITLNGNSIAFDTSTVLSSFYSIYGGVASVHAVDVTNLINSTDTNYVLDFPGPPNSSDTYTDFYLYVAYENSTMKNVNTAIFINTDSLMTFIPFNLNLDVPILNNVDVALSVSLGYMCDSFDGEDVHVDGTYLGQVWGADTNSNANGNIYCGGVMGSFYYKNDSVHALNDDNTDVAMDSSDGLSNIRSIVSSNTSSVNILFNDDSTGTADNSVWLAVLAYGNKITGVNSIDRNALIKIGPNLFSDRLNVNIFDHEIYEFIIYDVASRKIFENTFSGSTSINTEHFSRGIYIYTLSDKKGLISKGKLIKN